jgi:hypothetical protein
MKPSDIKLNHRRQIHKTEKKIVHCAAWGGSGRRHKLQAVLVKTILRRIIIIPS